MAEGGWVVLHLAEREVDRSGAGREAGKALGRPMQCRAEGRILFRGMDHPSAKAVAAALSSVGLPAAAVDQAQAPPLPPVSVCRSGRILPEGLLAGESATEPDQLLPWGDILALCCAVLERQVRPAEQLKSKWRYPPIFSAILSAQAERSRRRADRRRVTRVYFLDVITEGVRIRIESKGFNYGALGLAVEPASSANFLRLLAEVGRRAPRALRNPAAEGLLAGRTPPPVPDLTWLESDSEAYFMLAAAGRATE